MNLKAKMHQQSDGEKMQVPAIKRNRSAFREQMTDSGGERRTRCKIYIHQILQKTYSQFKNI